MKKRVVLLLLFLACASKEKNPEVWDPTMSLPTSVLGERRGYHIAKGIIHAHSIYSHDACDYEPVINGGINQQCFNDLRYGICNTKQNFVFMTDHISMMADQDDFTKLLLYVDGDELIYRNGKPVANKLKCGDGSSAIIMVGVESTPTPIGLEEHVPGDAQTRKNTYGRDDPGVVELYRQKGADVIITHAESVPLDKIRELKVDGMEIYNMHTNVDPEILKDDLGQDPAVVLANMFLFLNTSDDAPHPDLTFLGFFSENQNDLNRWQTLVLEQRITGIAATDSHQNTFKMPMRDGERGDSYRRMMKWFSNHLIVKEDSDTAFKEALKSGRSYIAFEAFGVPLGFDFYAEDSDGNVYEMGSEIQVENAAKLVVKIPRIYGAGSFEEQPEINLRLLKITASEVSEIATGGADIVLESPSRGVYRAEVRIIPWHLKKWLGTNPDLFMKEYVWIYSNPIYVR
jgi:hypothetical protein